MRGNRASRSSTSAIAVVALTALAAALAALGGAACAPAVETPAEAGYRRDLRDAARLEESLRHLPMVRSARVTITRPVADPLRDAAAPAAPARPAAPATPAASASIVLLLDGRADPDALSRDARALALAVAPELLPAAVAVLARAPEPPPVLSKVGPFEVARASRAPLQLALCLLLAACAGLGLTLAVRERRRR